MALTGLTFGSYEAILQEYYEPRLNLNQLSPLLLSSGVGERGKSVISGLSEQQLSMFRTGKRGNETILSYYKTPDI